MKLVYRLVCRLIGHLYCECCAPERRRCVRCGKKAGGPGFDEIPVPFPLKAKVRQYRERRRGVDRRSGQDRRHRHGGGHGH